jgi:hypothetical protein
MNRQIKELSCRICIAYDQKTNKEIREEQIVLILYQILNILCLPEDGGRASKHVVEGIVSQCNQFRVRKLLVL